LTKRPMTRSILALSSGALLALLLCCVSAAASDVLNFVVPSRREPLRAWLDAHPSHRLAVLEDCRCEDQVESLRHGPGGAWKPQPSYEPYYATGDFTGGGEAGFAVVVLPRRETGKILIVVFSGKPTGSVARPLVIPFPFPEKSVVGLGLFARRPSSARPQDRWQLLVRGFRVRSTAGRNSAGVPFTLTVCGATA
jgi:hypothetical protein